MSVASERIEIRIEPDLLNSIKATISLKGGWQSRAAWIKEAIREKLAKEEFFHAVRLTDGKPLYLSSTKIRYGIPTSNYTLRTGQLEENPRIGLVPYEFIRESKFASEIRIETTQGDDNVRS